MAAPKSCMNRVIQRQMVLRDVEKERFRQLMRSLEAFCGVRVLTYAILTEHFHLLIEVPVRKPLSDSAFLKRLGPI